MRIVCVFLNLLYFYNELTSFSSFEPKTQLKSLDLNVRFVNVLNYASFILNFCFSVYNKNRLLSDSKIGECNIPLKKLLDSEPHTDWYELVDKKGNQKGEIELEISCSDCRNR